MLVVDLECAAGGGFPSYEQIGRDAAVESQGA